MLSIAAGPRLVGRRSLPWFGAAAGDGVSRILCRSLHLHKAGSGSAVIRIGIGVDPPGWAEPAPASVYQNGLGPGLIGCRTLADAETPQVPDISSTRSQEN